MFTIRVFTVLLTVFVICNYVNSISFKVAPVKIEKSHFAPSTIEDAAEKIAQYWKRTNFYSDYFKNIETPGIKFETGQVNHDKLLAIASSPKNYTQKQLTHNHPFLGTLLAAWNNHLGITLTPDDFWVLITQGVTRLLNKNPKTAEKYRHKFVKHKGKKELRIFAKDYGIKPNSPVKNQKGWPLAIDALSQMIEDQTTTNISQIITKPFSTSGSIEKTVMKATLMESMKHYFDYDVDGITCGIPKMKLEGTLEDYKSIVERLNNLMEILPHFRWYLARVQKHMIKIAQTLERLKFGSEIDLNWWQKLLIREYEDDGYGGFVSRFTGWMADFLPEYSGDENFMDFHYPAVSMTDFLFETKFNDTQKMVHEMKLVTGFFGVALDEKSNGTTIRPVIGWTTYYWKEHMDILV